MGFERLRRITSSSRFIPEIDGLRFIAIALVVFFHIGVFTRFIGSHVVDIRDSMLSPAASFVFALSRDGDRGVYLFFTISGFILGLPFAKHYVQGAPKVGLKAYFLRRLTRLEPPYVIATLAVFVLLIAVGKYTFAELWPSLPVTLAYLYNLLPLGPVINGVTWSLEIEVQFYLLAPILAQVFRLPRVWRRALLAALIIGIPLARLPFPTYPVTLWNYVEYFLLGFLLVDVYLEGLRVPLSRVASAIIGTLLLCLVVTVNSDYTTPHLTLLGCIFGFYFLVLTDPLWKRLLSIPALTVIGGMCYSIYLWHYVIISSVGRLTEKAYAHFGHVPLSAQLAINCLVFVPAILLFSTGFYLLIERPCMDKDWPRKLTARLHHFFATKK